MPYTDEQILTLSPFSVILMMSLIDGGNQYNIERIHRFLEKLHEKQFEAESQLLQNKLNQLLSDVDFISGVLQNNPLEVVRPLGKVRKILDEKHPDEASDFCNGLISLAKLAATHTDPNGSIELTDNELKYEKFLNIMLRDDDPKAREEIALIIEFLCLAGSSENEN